MDNVEATYQQALALHQAGSLDEAGRMYREILKDNPRHAPSLHLIGVIALQGGDGATAERHIRLALRFEPNAPVYYNSLGETYRSAGRMRRAEQAYRESIRLDPQFAEAYNNLGLALQSRSGARDAAAAFGQAISLKPDYATPRLNLANLLMRAHRWADVLPHLHHLVGAAPDDATVLGWLGEALLMLGRHDEAIPHLQRCAARNPGQARIMNALGVALGRAGRKPDALAWFRKAYYLAPDDPDVLHNLGSELTFSKMPEDAAALLARANALKPDWPEALNSLANAQLRSGSIDDALVTFQKVLRVKPSYAKAHTNRAIGYLLKGDLLRGWEEYRWRLDSHPQRFSPILDRTRLWRGGSLKGRTVLLIAEQGFGDTIMFVRYASMLADIGARAVLACQPELIQLLRMAKGLEKVVAWTEPPPDCAIHLPLMDLGCVFETTLETIPSVPAYLTPPVKRTRPDTKGLRVGLVWAGRPDHPNNANRSVSLDAFLPLLDVENVTFVGLQTGESAADATAKPWAGRMENMGPELKDFADTAAVVDTLDLVIGVDTAVIHLAGALGKPVWLMIPPVPDWRWFMSGDQSPWYPTLRLYRQENWQEWEPVVERIKSDLSTFD